MKKLILVLAILLAFTTCLAACDGGNAENSDPDIPSENPITEAPTNNTSGAHTDKPTERPTENTSEAPTSAPTEQPTEAPTDVPTYNTCEHNYENKICTMCGEQQPSEGLEFTSNDDGTCCVIDIGSCTDTDVVIPSFSPNGDRVTSIDGCAFYGCESLTSVVIPHSVTSIGKEAFQYCDNLISVAIPDSVTSIGNYAFRYCDKFSEVHISSIEAWCKIDFDSNPLQYAHNLYLNGELVTELVIPDSVTSIGSKAFSGCTSLTSAVISDSVTTIGESVFYDCRELTSVTIGCGVTELGSSAFLYCMKLVEVINKSSLNIITGASSAGYAVSSALEVHSGESKIVNKDGYLFYTYNGVNYLVNYVGTATELTLPESYNGENYEIHQYAFHVNKQITSVVISDSVTSIGYAAFGSCANLTDVVIGNSVTSIAERTFSNCDNLATVIIPKSVTSIGPSAFYSCFNPTIYCEATEQPSGWDNKWSTKSFAVVVWGYTGEE